MTPQRQTTAEGHNRESSRHAGDAAGNYVSFAFTADDAGNSSSARRPSRCRTPPLLSSPSSLPDYTVECSTKCRWMTHGVRQLRKVTIEVSSETTAGDAAGNYGSFALTATDDAETALRLQTSGAGHHRS